MNHLKLFEAFNKEYYTKALSQIRTMIDSDEDKSKLISYIDSLTTEDKKDLDNIRIIINRTTRCFNGYSQYVFYNRKSKASKKRKAGSDYQGSWEAGDRVNRDTYSVKKYIVVPVGGIHWATDYLQSQKNQYTIIMSKLDSNDIHVNRLKLLCDRFFEILEWCIETSTKKSDLMSNYEMDEDSRKTAIENLSDWDFENEIDEITRLSKLIGLTVTKINS
jgi:hypothetical protein